jgi:MOB kinase activator 1
MPTTTTTTTAQQLQQQAACIASRHNLPTFRPKKSTPVGSKGLQLKRHIDATLGQGDLWRAVALPPGEDLDEWLAVNVVDFYNAASVLYSTLAVEFCTARSCPVMSAGSRYEYLWPVGEAAGGGGGGGSAAAPQDQQQQQRQRPLRLSAPEYIDRLFDWIEAQIDDERLFPQQLGAPFPQGFRTVAATILRRLFRVYAHCYHSHFRQVVALGEEAHLNTCFKHFALFVRHFGLVDGRELAPLAELIDELCGKSDNGGGGGGVGAASGAAGAAAAEGAGGGSAGLAGAAAGGAAAAAGGGGERPA